VANLQTQAQARQQQAQQEQQEDAQQALRYGQSPLTLVKGNPELEYPQAVPDIRKIPSQIAEMMGRMDPQEANEWMSGLEEQFPGIAGMVRQVQEVGLGQSMMKPLPEQRPPNRLASPI
jgi:hypothetical protein